MNKDFIPYEQALALKELRFNEPCLCFYGSKKELNFNDLFKTNSDLKNTTNWISAPTFSQAFRWFREKYKLHSTITSISQESWQWHITRPTESLGKLYDEDFYTYEEAELECLVKLIEIVKYGRII